MCPEYGHKTGTTFSTVFGPELGYQRRLEAPNFGSEDAHQAEALWQWSRFLIKQAVAMGKTPLLINLDETSVPVVPAGTKGIVMVVNGWQAWHRRPTLSATVAERRLHFTHVAIICDNPVIQKLLPRLSSSRIRC